jgi:hypothetical protein
MHESCVFLNRRMARNRLTRQLSILDNSTSPTMCHRWHVPFIPRAEGRAVYITTGLAGSALFIDMSIACRASV